MANLDQIMDYLADNAIHYKDYSGTTGTTASNGWYYADVDLNLPAGAIVLSAYCIYIASQRPAIVQAFSSLTKMRVMTSYQSTAYNVRVVYIGSA